MPREGEYADPLGFQYRNILGGRFTGPGYTAEAIFNQFGLTLCTMYIHSVNKLNIWQEREDHGR